MVKHIKRLIAAITACCILMSPSTAFASMNGVDVSSWQTGIDVSDMQMDFVIAKATEGTSYINPDCDRVYQDAKGSGKALGVYHFARVGDALSQAEYFVDNISGYIGEAVLVLDYEGNAVNQGVGWAKDWLDAVYNMTGVKPVIYMSNSVIHRYDWSSVQSAGYGLWNAAYYYGYQTIHGFLSNPPRSGSVSPWDANGMIYQYTSSGRLNGWGGNLDLNIYYGNRSDWNNLAGYTTGNDYTPSEPEHTAEDKVIYYTVQYGDTLSGIAAMYNTTYTYLAKLNGISNPNLIYSGQRIVISGKYESSAGHSTTSYTVQWGDCLSTIGVKLGVSWKSIANANGIHSPYTIYTGQVLTIPSGKGDTGTYYTVRSGDCLSTIAAKYGTSYQNIARLNGISYPYTIYPNQTLRVV